jgi:hypothetical protein
MESDLRWRVVAEDIGGRLFPETLGLCWRKGRH